MWRKKKKEAETQSLIVQTTSLAQNEKDIWYVDSGCSKHITGHENKFSTLMLNDGKTKVENVLFVEGLKHNLLSVNQLCDQEHSLTFNSDCYKISKDGVHIVDASRAANNIYILDDVKSETCCLNLLDES